jgi:uncharacterized protein (DUF488 family)
VARTVIHTVGHGRRTTDELTAHLKTAGVQTLIDVRRYPAGRRQPHLSRERLAVDVPQRGLAYEWSGEQLGGRRTADAETVAASAWRNAAFAAYDAYTHTPPFRSALQALEARARAGEAIAIMCAETLWWRCHRRLIADALVADGFAVDHLITADPASSYHTG